MAGELVSIVIPTYNGSKRIARTLGALIAQTYGNIEIIVVDDASTDDTVNTAYKVLAESTRTFRIIRRSSNGRQSASRNTGLNDARGKYVIFFDHDDTAHKDFVSKLCEKAEHENADLVYCGLRNLNEHDGTFSDESTTVDSTLPEEYLEAWTRGQIDIWSVWNYIFRKDFIDAYGLKFHEGCMLGEDTEFVLKALARASKAGSISDVLYTYIHHSDQTSVIYPDMFNHVLLSRLRAANYLRRYVNNPKVMRYVVSWFVPDAIIKQATIYAEHGQREEYLKFTRTLRHRKIREVLLSGIRFLFKRPELFIKSLMIIFTPALYYRLRRKNKP